MCTCVGAAVGKYTMIYSCTTLVQLRTEYAQSRTRHSAGPRRISTQQIRVLNTKMVV